MMVHHGGQDGRRRGLAGLLRMTVGRTLIVVPAAALVVGCGAVEAVGNFPNPKDTVTVYTTPPPRPPAAVVSAALP